MPCCNRSERARNVRRGIERNIDAGDRSKRQAVEGDINNGLHRFPASVARRLFPKRGRLARGVRLFLLAIEADDDPAVARLMNRLNSSGPASATLPSGLMGSNWIVLGKPLP